MSPAKGFQLRSVNSHPDRSVAFPPKAVPQATSWWLALSPAEFYAKAKTEQARMSPTLWNTVIAKDKEPG